MSPESGDRIRSARFRRPIWMESGHLAREAGSGQERPAGRTDLARWSESSRLCCRNLAIPDSDETIRIPAFISNSGYISRNQVKMVKILSVNDWISYSMIFILFYINIYMFWIKINFYRLIWLNENMKNICDFLYAPNTKKCFRRKIFSKNMTSLKPFYDGNHFTSKQTKHKNNSIGC